MKVSGWYTNLGKLSNYFNIKTVLFIAILVRLIMFVNYTPWQEDVVTNKIMTGDVIEYHNFALNLLSGEFKGDTRILPGLPFYLAFIYFLFGVNPWVVMLFNIVLSVLSIFFLYKTALLFSTARIALLASLWMALDIQMVGFSLTLLSDIPAIFLLTIVFYSMVRSLKSVEIKYLIISGFTLGLVVLLRPIGQFLIFLMITAILIRFYKDRNRLFKFTSIVTIVYLFVLMPLLIHNMRNYNHFALGTLGGHNLLNYNAKSVLLVQKKMSLKQSDAYIEDKLKKMGGDTVNNPFEKEELQIRVAFDLIWENKTEYLTNHINGCINLYTALSTVNLSKILGLEKFIDNSFYWGPSNFDRVKFYLQRDSHGVLILSIVMIAWLMSLYISAGIGIFSLLSEKQYFVLGSILLVILYYTLITGVVSVARYRLPIHPFLMILSAYGINFILQSIDNKPLRKQNRV